MILRKTQRGGGKSIKTARILAAAAVAALGGGVAHASTLYWDANSALGGTGTWDINNTVAWKTTNTAGAPTDKWVTNDGTFDAQFAGTAASTITVTGAINANSILFANTLQVYTFSGTGSLTLASGTIATNTATTNTGAQTFNRPITVTGGGNLIVANNTATGDSSVALAAANSAGDLRFTSTGSGTGRDAVNLNNTQAINNTSSVNHANVVMDRNGAQLGFAGAGIWDGQTFYPNITLNAADSATAGFLNHIGLNASYEINYAGTISSGATGTHESNLRFGLGTSGGTGVFNLMNAASYGGYTQFTNANQATHFAGTVRNITGADNALPVTTRLIFGPSSLTAAAGAYDLNGRSQTITGISTSSTPVAIGGVINTDGVNQGTLKINATATQAAYTGNIGKPYESLTTNTGTVTTIYKAGATSYSTNDNIAVETLSTSTSGAVVSFNRLPGMTYTGGTLVNGGTLSVNNTSGSGTGSGTVTVGSSGTLGGGGIITGATTVSGKVAPGNSAGTLTFSGGLTLNASSAADMEFASTPANDKVVINNASTLTLPGSGTININLFDLGSGIHTTTDQGGSVAPYTLFDYTAGALSGNPVARFNVVAPTSGGAQFATFTINNAGGLITLSVAGAGNDLSWRGDGSGNGAWDVLTTANWFDTGTALASKYNNPDLVTFDDNTTGVGPHTITVDAGGVSPSSVTVKGTHEFTIGGGAIGGITKISKSGTGKLTLTGSNTFTGGTTITQGTLAITSDAALGTAAGSPAINLTVSKTTSTNSTYMRFEDDMTLNVNRTIKLSQSGGGGGGPELAAAALKTVTINGDITSGAGGTTFLFRDDLAGTHTGTINLRGNNTTNAGGGFLQSTVVSIGTVNVIADNNFGGSGGVQLNGSTVNALTGTLQFGASFTTSRAFSFGGPITGGGGTLDIPTGVSTTISSIITGTTQMTKTGPGTLTAGAVRIIKDDPAKAGALTINNGTLTIAFNGVNGPHPPGNTGDNSTSKVNKLNLAGTTDAWTSTLDLVDNDLVIQSDAVNAAADYATAYNQVKMAINGGGGPWTGTGITSSKAAANTDLLYAVGIISNNDAQFGGLGDPLYATFSGQTADANAILIKSTYFGDANLDGTVDITDYGLIDTAFNNQTVDGGWVNGDFDYSGGTVDISDYGLIDGAFGNQMIYMDGYLTPGLAGASAVPEPASLGLIAAAGAGLLVRRRRSH